MSHAPALALQPTVTTAMLPRGHLRRVVSGWLATWSVDPRQQYLSQAVDHADLGARMRQWDEMERRAARLTLGLPSC